MVYLGIGPKKGSLWRNIVTDMFPPAPSFTESNLPDLTNKVFLVTGGTSGVGKDVCRILYHRGGHVIVGARSRSGYDAAVADIQANAGHVGSKIKPITGTLQFLHIDLSDLTTIKPAVDNLMQSLDRLDVAFYNAGVMAPPVGSKTAQGYELQWGTNVVGHFLLNRFLAPLQSKTSSSSPPGTVRTVWVSSNGHNGGPGKFGIQWDDLNFEKEPNQFKSYFQSKAAAIILAHEGGVRSPGVVNVAVHPGFIATNLARDMDKIMGGLVKCLVKLLAAPPRSGALAEIYAGLAPEPFETKDEIRYIIPFGRLGFINPRVEDGILNYGTGERLWQLLEKETDKYAI